MESAVEPCVVRLLFVCVENAGRSQMAEAFARRHGGAGVVAASAGSRPLGHINPEVAEAMRERGYDLAAHRSKSVRDACDLAGNPTWTRVVTMGCGDDCPWVPAESRDDWPLDDPRTVGPGGVRAVRDEIERRVVALLHDVQPVPAGEDLATIVRAKYGAAAARAAHGELASCCGPTCCSGNSGDARHEMHGEVRHDPITSDLYVTGETDLLPSAAVLASLGCGNPVALASLEPGQTVLDLGSGGGIDVLLSARRVGPTGKAYGLDMTDEMLDLARRNARDAKVTNVEFLKGRIEQIPLPDNSVDVVISNCVINLSGDKRRVLAEAFRVLKPGGRFAVSDVVVTGDVPPAVRRNMELWVGCVAGALEEGEFLSLLGDVGFRDAAIEPTRVYRAADAAALLGDNAKEYTGYTEDKEYEGVMAEVDGKFMAAFVRAAKPLA